MPLQNYTNITHNQIKQKNNYIYDMKTLYIILFLSLASCMSASKHYEKAIKKGFTPEKETITKRTFTLLPIHDTITNEVIRVDTIHEIETRTIYQDRPLLRYETRLIRDTIRITEKANTARLKALIKKDIQSIKTEKKHSKWWLWLLIGGALVYFRKYVFKLLPF